MDRSIKIKSLEGLVSLASRSWIPIAPSGHSHYNKVGWVRNTNQQSCLCHSHSRPPPPSSSSSRPGFLGGQGHDNSGSGHTLLAGSWARPDGRPCLLDRRHRLVGVGGGSSSSRLCGRLYSSSSSGSSGNDQHALLCEQDRKEWVENKKQQAVDAMEMRSKRKDLPFLTAREKYKNGFLRSIIHWQKINVTWETLPYHISEESKSLLVECAASHLGKDCSTPADVATKKRLNYSSERVLLQSVAGSELYRERVVKALARDFKVPLLLVDTDTLCGSYDMEYEDYDDSDSDFYGRSDFESDEEDGDTSDEEKGSSSKSKPEQQPPLKIGDRVKYIGAPRPRNSSASNSCPPNCLSLTNGQRGEVCEVNGDWVKVALDFVDDKAQDMETDYECSEEATIPSVIWMHVTEVQQDLDTQSGKCYIAVEVLCEVLRSLRRLIVYFPDSSRWLAGVEPQSDHEKFICEVEKRFDELSGPVLLVCGNSKRGKSSRKDVKLPPLLNKFTKKLKYQFDSNGIQRLFTNVLCLHPPEPPLLNKFTKELKYQFDSNGIQRLFTNVLCLHPPEEENLLRAFNNHLEEDIKVLIQRHNLNLLHEVLERHELMVANFWHVDANDRILTKDEVEKVVGWAKNHYLSTRPLPSTSGEKMQIPAESFETAIMRLKDQEAKSEQPSDSANIKALAADGYERGFASEVVSPKEIDVKFDDVGALEHVKNTLKELIILPMRRPELFSHGNLLRPCKGILLFGPPGTGKTLLAKALATEAGAHFISITMASIMSKWYGEVEKNVKGLFSFASKLAPVIIFIDEVDNIFACRGGTTEHEATREIRNEFMVGMDGLTSKENQRILVIAATNRPFDLDDAFIRRLPRRIYMDLPDAENRRKILKTILKKENLESNFDYDKLAHATKGYSGSDLKNLCIAAAYRPIHELLEKEEKEGKNDASSNLRPLNLQDFVQSTAQVGPSVFNDGTTAQKLRKWNEKYGEGGSPRCENPLQNLQNLAMDEYESKFVSEVVRPGEINVKFDDVGALDNVKKTLNDFVILPMKSPELFSHGNLMRPCKGILLFGPPGTGKTLLAKALATEAGAHFINITTSTITSMWYGEEQKNVRGLFSFATRLSPVIIFVDEADSIFGARGLTFENEGTRKTRNEFMAAMDGLKSNDTQRIIIIGATNRPFDLDDAFIRRLPRRIYVDLPDAQNRRKILQILLVKEKLESNFEYEKLAHATEGYSGSDLKNLCIAAAYRPVLEHLEQKKKGNISDVSALRPLNLQDFLLSKTEVGPSVVNDSESITMLKNWNEQYGQGGSRQNISTFGFAFDS